MQYLLWADIVTKAGIGALLLVLPLSFCKLFGLDRPALSFWPRLAGALMLGIAAATLLPLYRPETHGGLGPAGLIPINLVAAAAIIGPLVMGRAAPTRRGKALLIVLTLVFLAIGFLLIAHA